MLDEITDNKNPAMLMPRSNEEDTRVDQSQFPPKSVTPKASKGLGWSLHHFGVEKYGSSLMCHVWGVGVHFGPNAG